ncbi:MAG: class I SAM-dependent methyltransferase [Planctomycetota bacterium]|jgi:SAM-dependent methyltransferase
MMVRSFQPRPRSSDLLEPALRAVLGERAAVVDVSSGGGDWARYLCRLGYSVHGVDHSRRRLARNRAMAARLGVRATFALGTSDALPVGDGMFDAVLVRHLVSRLDRPHQALKEWLRVLRSGGRILLIDSFPAERRWWSGLHRKLARTERERLLVPPPHPAQRRAPFRSGIPAREARTFLRLAEVRQIRTHELSGSPGYLVSGLKT